MINTFGTHRVFRRLKRVSVMKYRNSMAEEKYLHLINDYLRFVTSQTIDFIEKYAIVQRQKWHTPMNSSRRVGGDGLVICYEEMAGT